MSAEINEVDMDDFDATAAPAAAAYAGSEELPEWAREGTEADDDEIVGEDISSAKPMEGRAEWIEPVKGVLFTIEKAVIESYTPRGENEWKSKSMNVWLKVADGITYKKGEKPKYKGKIFFHRFYVAVNRKAEQGGIYDFSVNAQGKPTDFWKPSGNAFGDYNAFLTALGFSTKPAPTNNNAFRESLKGRQIVYDIDKDPKESYDSQTNKRTRVSGEYENKLRNAAPAKGKESAASAAPAAAVASTDTADWDKE